MKQMLRHLFSLSFLDNFLIHSKHKTTPYELKKARLFVSLPSFMILLSLICALLSFGLGDFGEMPHILPGALACIVPLWLFRVRGNMKLSGNILVGIYAIIVGEAVFRTGGLYSDNLIWLMFAPMLAMFFAGKSSGFAWLVALCSFAFYVYSIEPGGQHGFRIESYDLDNQYFISSFISMFVAYTFMVTVFVTGSELLAKELISQKNECQLRTVEATQKAEALEIAEVKLLTKNKELEQFAYAASHDLREPLRMIATYSNLLNRRHNGQLDAMNQEFLGFVVDGAARMEVMLKDLLEFARLGNEGEKAIKMDMELAVNHAISNLAIRIQETGASVHCEKLPVVLGAETQLVRLFQNLMSNAIKFARKDVAPVINIRYQLEANRMHTIYCEDNGIGIPKEARERIFNVFERLHGRTAYDGAGIGLASCKKIVNNMGGTISVVDSPNDFGTIFKISIPIPIEMNIPIVSNDHIPATSNTSKNNLISRLANPLSKGFESSSAIMEPLAAV
jgi:signal transduction histidine kinase